MRTSAVGTRHCPDVCTDPEFEFHGYDLFGGNGPFEGMSPAKRIAICGDVLDCIGRVHAKVIVRGVYKPGLAARYANPFHPHDIALIAVRRPIKALAAETGRDRSCPVAGRGRLARGRCAPRGSASRVRGRHSWPPASCQTSAQDASCPPPAVGDSSGSGRRSTVTNVEVEQPRERLVVGRRSETQVLRGMQRDAQARRREHRPQAGPVPAHADARTASARACAEA